LAATGIAFRGNTKGFQDAIFNIVATVKGVLGQDGSLEKSAKTATETDKKNKEKNELKEKPLNNSKSDDRLGSLMNNYKTSSPIIGKEPEVTGNIGENGIKLGQPSDQPVLDGGGVKLGMPPALIGPYSLRLAAARGDVRAEYEVARRFSYGLGVPKDAEQAVKWYMQGASKGFAPSQYRLATYYERGRGIEKNLGRAKVWYQRAAMLGNVKAMHNLAVISTALDKEDTDYKAAIYWFKQAANRNLADSQFNLAILYQNGVGLKKDNIEAYKWFSLAARQGDVDAAARRDTLEKKLKKEELLKASQLLQGWRALTIDAKANDVGRISSHITSTMSHAHETVSRSRILTAQILLRKLGYGLKAADGSMNEETIRAVKKFEKDKGLPITGKINPDLIQKLNKASL
jgi:localization factor PodJL